MYEQKYRVNIMKTKQRLQIVSRIVVSSYDLVVSIDKIIEFFFDKTFTFVTTKSFFGYLADILQSLNANKWQSYIFSICASTLDEATTMMAVYTSIESLSIKKKLYGGRRRSAISIS